MVQSAFVASHLVSDPAVPDRLAEMNMRQAQSTACDLAHESVPVPALDNGADDLRAAASSEAPHDERVDPPSPANRNAPAAMTVLLVVPTLEAGAADTHACDLVAMLARAGSRAIVVSRGGRLAANVVDAGGEFVPMNVASKNPLAIARCAHKLARLIRQRDCTVVHALGRAPAWSAHFASRLTGRPLVTSWLKGFRDQNRFKRLYNSAMVRGARIITASEQIADLVHDRYATPWERIRIIPTVLDAARYDPSCMTPDRIERVRALWGIGSGCRIILVPGRMLRRKGHHLVVQAAHHLKMRGHTDFKCIFIGEDQGRTRYTGQLWDLITATGTNDVVRLAGTVDDRPAAMAAASVIVSASTQAEGVQRAIVEAQAMSVPVVVSDLGAGPDVVLAPPAIGEDRMTGLRVPSGDSRALADALARMLTLPEATRAAIGGRGRDWVLGHFDEQAIADQILRLYAEVAGPAYAAPRPAAL